LGVSHKNLRSYYNFSTTTNKVAGNTAGLLMLRKNLFEKIEGFNESYRVCFEDVELNLQCVVHGFENICDGSLVAYHYESQTRKNSSEEITMMNEDFKNILVKFIYENKDKLQSWIKL
jgi:GT2 family glycosyltransferase